MCRVPRVSFQLSKGKAGSGAVSVDVMVRFPGELMYTETAALQWRCLFLIAKFLEGFDAALVLRIQLHGFLVVHDGQFFLSGLQEGLSQAVVGVPEFWVVLHFQLKYLESGVGLPSHEEVVAEGDQ